MLLGDFGHATAACVWANKHSFGLIINVMFPKCHVVAFEKVSIYYTVQWAVASALLSIDHKINGILSSETKCTSLIHFCFLSFPSIFCVPTGSIPSSHYYVLFFYM